MPATLEELNAAKDLIIKEFILEKYLNPIGIFGGEGVKSGLETAWNVSVEDPEFGHNENLGIMLISRISKEIHKIYGEEHDHRTKLGKNFEKMLKAKLNELLPNNKPPKL